MRVLKGRSNLMRVLKTFLRIWWWRLDGTLRRITTEAESPIEQLTVKQVWRWYCEGREDSQRTGQLRRLFWTCRVKGRSTPLANNTSNSAIGGGLGRAKKVLTKGLTDRGRLDKVIKSSERDAAHQTERRHRIRKF